MLLEILLLIVGFVLLIKGADIFVDGASSVASNFKISKMLIGLTIVAFGTSAPEFAVSIKSLVSGNGDMVLGNVIGSNIMNILLILGSASAFVHYLNVKNNTVKKELPITMLITILFAVLLSDNLFDSGISNSFTRSDGIILLLFFLVYIYYLISMMRNKIEDNTEEIKMPLIKSIVFTILGILGIIIGSNFVVDSSSSIASFIGVSDRMISLTIIALGTSLPELVTSLIATKKGEYDLAIGNVVGSNIFNLGAVIGIPVALFGGINKISFSYIDVVVMIMAAILLYVFSFRTQRIAKIEGIIFLVLFIVYYSYVVFM